MLSFLFLSFNIVQLSYPYMPTEKTIGLTKQKFVSRVMSLVFNMLSSLVTTFLPRSKPVAWNIQDIPFSRPCLPGLTFKGITLSFIYKTTCTKVCIPCLYSVYFYITYPASLQFNDLTIRYSYFPSAFVLSLSYRLLVHMPWTHSALLLFLLEIVI